MKSDDRIEMFGFIRAEKVQNISRYECTVLLRVCIKQSLTRTFFRKLPFIALSGLARLNRFNTCRQIVTEIAKTGVTKQKDV